MKLSNQAIGAIMLALQNSLAHQTDIMPIFEGWNLFIKDGQVFVDNPPVLEVDDDDFSEGEEEEGDDDVLDFLTRPDEE